MSNWILCNACEAEFKVVSEKDEEPEFCPFCGDSDLDTEESEEEESDEED